MNANKAAATFHSNTTPPLHTLVAELHTITENITNLERRRDTLRAAIRDQLGDNATTVTGNYQIRIQTTSRFNQARALDMLSAPAHQALRPLVTHTTHTIDAKKLEALAPDLYRACKAPAAQPTIKITHLPTETDTTGPDTP